MITHLRGTLVSKEPVLVTIDVGGIGYSVHIPLSTYEKLPEKDSAVALYTHFHVREDEMSLYGFHTEEERKMFRLLIGISGIGPKVALGILSGTGILQLKKAVMELRDKFGAADDGDEWLREGGETELDSTVMTTVSALETLGYSRKQALEAAKKSARSLGADALPEDLIRDALSNIR